jgi:hypothetical protein
LVQAPGVLARVVLLAASQHKVQRLWVAQRFTAAIQVVKMTGFSR